MHEKSLLETTSAIYKRIFAAAMRAGRNPEDIVLIAVTKTVGPEHIREAIDLGLRMFGENRVQEAKEKIAFFKNIPERIQWHMIGHLQRNKVKYAISMFDLIHSVDSIELARDINSHAERIRKVQDVLVEVKLSSEKSKHGVPKDQLAGLLRAVSSMKNVTLKGLMTIPPLLEDCKDTRPFFRELRELRDASAALGFHLPELSMGMSDDFEIAIEEGATMLRIGTALFGERR
ncbi:MAG TPA: YggS family pyridoxal phosphate-dependent enzyme [Nitrospiraceae bacterium]|jgi:pyridoxal phosphate enzyme (YggS family)|nr:YggS family pyridoxal phosphate-dependent enzyme [Nitrospiraceae bacterium]